MSETTWLPLPTHGDWWWRSDELFPSDEPRPVYVEMQDGKPWNVMKRDGVTYAPVAPPPPKFANTYCSQCGREFGPGNHGYSHCENHDGKTPID